VQKTVRPILGNVDNVLLTEPLDYLPFVQLMKRSYLILTDSGGLQEEAPSLGKPVLVLRETTERPEGVAAGAVEVIGTKAKQIIEKRRNFSTTRKGIRRWRVLSIPMGTEWRAREL
jgi:UDP-N-acetylglucosamine 2-epimerase (non-hydrolysing)